MKKYIIEDVGGFLLFYDLVMRQIKWSIYLCSESLDGLLCAGCVNSFFLFFLAKRSIVELFGTRYASQHFPMTR